eukprot:scaffold4588_cov62-Phaeocystis_antarctica.AAC.4
MAAYASSGPCAASGAAETILPDARSVCITGTSDEALATWLPSRSTSSPSQWYSSKKLRSALSTHACPHAESAGQWPFWPPIEMSTVRPVQGELKHDIRRPHGSGAIFHAASSVLRSSIDWYAAPAAQHALSAWTSKTISPESASSAIRGSRPFAAPLFPQ